MQLMNPYNEIVRACFAKPNHAGDLRGGYANTYTAEVAESGHGVRLVLTVGITDGRIAEMRFRAWACPHLIAAAETACTDREQGMASALVPLDRREMMQRLSIPSEKIGRILLLEDALASLANQYEQATIC